MKTLVYGLGILTAVVVVMALISLPTLLLASLIPSMTSIFVLLAAVIAIYLVRYQIILGIFTYPITFADFSILNVYGIGVLSAFVALAFLRAGTYN